MAYVNPFGFFDLSLDRLSDLDKKTIRRTRQRTLAEFELSEETALERNGLSIDKNTALQLLDELSDENRRRWHWWIYKNPELRAFLEDPGFARLESIPELSEGLEPDFVAFLSKWFAPAFGDLLFRSIREESWSAALTVLAYVDFVAEKDQPQAFDPVVRLVRGKIERLEKLTEQVLKQIAPFPSDAELWDHELMQVLNDLPDAHQGLRNDYAEALHDLSIEVNNKIRDEKKAYLIILQASRLKVDHAIHSRIQHLKEQFKVEEESESASSSSGSRAHRKTQAAGSKSGCFGMLGLLLSVGGAAVSALGGSIWLAVKLLS